MTCPECNSDKLIKFGMKFIRDKKSNKRIRIQQYQCKNCGRITIYPLN
jgi:transcription elongation factor Elf1